MDRLRVIDSHTGGEPTRVVIEGAPSHSPEALRREFDRYRTAVIGEPRSSPVAVGAYLLPSERADFGILFFNNAGYLGMCGHGLIGVVATLAYLGRMKPGEATFETPAGLVTATLQPDGRVSFDNVVSYRLANKVAVGGITGDVAYGGNWFFISQDHGLRVVKSNIAELTEFSNQLRVEIARQGITGADGAEIDHVELVGPSDTADGRNFVLCPGGEYDRSPCGTGTSAKLACLHADGKLADGEVWRQESIIGSVFEGRARAVEGGIVPTITGQAFVCGDSTLVIDPDDPFAWGIP